MQAIDASQPREDVRTEVGVWFGLNRFLILLAGLLVISFPRVVCGLDSFFFRDYGTLAYPFVHFHRETFWRGELPFWNPLSNCGTPFLAQWNTLVLYPFSLIYLVFPLPWSLNYFCLAHLMVAGAGMHLLAKRWTGDPFAASLAGVAYVFSGVMLSSHIYPNYLVTLAWMPWVVRLAQRAWSDGGARSIAAAGVVGALQMLSGAPEIILQTWVLICALWLADWWRQRGPRETNENDATSAPSFRRRAGRLLAVMSLVAGLAAAQLVPFLDLLAHSQRGLDYGGQLWTMPGWGWASFLVPLFHCFSTPQGVYFQSGQAFLVSYYLGIVPFAFALLALWRVGEARVKVLGLVGALGLLLALGNEGFLYPWLRQTLPGLGVSRFPIKFVYLPSFVCPVLAAYAIASIGGARPAASNGFAWQVGILGGLCLVVVTFLVIASFRYPSPGEVPRITAVNALARLAFLGMGLGLAYAGLRPGRDRGKAWILLGILVVVWLDVMTHTPCLAPHIPNDAYTARVLEIPNPPRAGESRVMISPRAEQLLISRTLPDFTTDFLGSRLAMWSNLNVSEGVPKVNGAATLQLRAEAELESLLYASTNRIRSLEKLLGVAYMSSPANPVEWVPLPDPSPMLTIGQRPAFGEPSEVLAAMSQPGFDGAHTVFLPPEAKTSIAATGTGSSRVLSSRFANNLIKAEVETTSGAILVIAQSYYHRWQAKVDGKDARLWQADCALQAVEVPRGRHSVTIEYVDRPFEWASGVSALSVLVAGLGFRRGPRNGPEFDHES